MYRCRVQSPKSPFKSLLGIILSSTAYDLTCFKIECFGVGVASTPVEVVFESVFLSKVFLLVSFGFCDEFMLVLQLSKG